MTSSCNLSLQLTIDANALYFLRFDKQNQPNASTGSGNLKTNVSFREACRTPAGSLLA